MTSFLFLMALPLLLQLFPKKQLLLEVFFLGSENEIEILTGLVSNQGNQLLRV